VALNRAIAVGQLEGPQRGLEVIASSFDPERLATYPFYWAAMGEFELRLNRLPVAAMHFSKAQSLARNEGERKFFGGRIDACK
jgi:predicted RNA polymerase sigma factor